VTLYGSIEIAIGLYALVVPLAFARFPELNRAWLYTLGFWPAATTRFLLALAVLLVPTILMGATLPILVAALVRDDSRVGSSTGLLYGLNTLGAVVGVFVATFVLFPLLGLTGTGMFGAVWAQAELVLKVKEPLPEAVAAGSIVPTGQVTTAPLTVHPGGAWGTRPAGKVSRTTQPSIDADKPALYVFQDGFDQSELGVELVVDGRARDICSSRNFLHRRPVKPVLGEHRSRGRDDPSPRLSDAHRPFPKPILAGTHA
jgi:hypothetical protein